LGHHALFLLKNDKWQKMMVGNREYGHTKLDQSGICVFLCHPAQREIKQGRYLMV